MAKIDKNLPKTIDKMVKSNTRFNSFSTRKGTKLLTAVILFAIGIVVMIVMVILIMGGVV